MIRCQSGEKESKEREKKGRKRKGGGEDQKSSKAVNSSKKHSKLCKACKKKKQSKQGKTEKISEVGGKNPTRHEKQGQAAKAVISRENQAQKSSSKKLKQ